MSDSLDVLVVDEDRDVRELTSTFLERADEAIAVQTAVGGEEALDRLEREPFDAVVSDFRMPGMNGLELAEAVDDREIDVAFVLFSAADDPMTTDAVEASDVDGFVLKGSGTDHYGEIVDVIHDALAGA